MMTLDHTNTVTNMKSYHYKDEMMRNRELPVPPMPRMSGVWSLSMEQLPGNYTLGIIHQPGSSLLNNGSEEE